MADRKYLHAQFLATDGNDNMTWVERLPDGRLFTILSHSKNTNQDGKSTNIPTSQFLFGRISDDNGKTWNPPYFLYEWPELIPQFLFAGFKFDRAGRLHVFAMEMHDRDIKSLDGNIAYVRFDSYRGENPYFSDIPALNRYTGSLNNAIETESGRLVVPFSTFVKGRFVSNTIYSDDHGTTWSASANIAIADDETDPETGAVEPVVVEVKPGVLVILIRTVLSRLWYAVSYDEGASWSKPQPTALISSNSPAVLLKLPSGRIFVAWNDVQGQPMSGVRYSSARQCLHAAVSDDGLQHVHGIRTVLKKQVGDQDTVHNAYPTVAMYDDTSILLRTLEVMGKDGSDWKVVQGFLGLLDPAFLDEREVCNNWDEWVCDHDETETGIRLTPTKENMAHAIVNFPYGQNGELTLRVSGDLPQGTKVLLSDCYIDRYTFLPSMRDSGYNDKIGKPYTEFAPTASGEWVLRWDDTAVTLLVDGNAVQTVNKAENGGFNHLTVMFDGDGELSLNHFTVKVDKADLKTDITY